MRAAHRRPERAGRARCDDDADSPLCAEDDDDDDETIRFISANCPSSSRTFWAKSLSAGPSAAPPTGDRLRPERLVESLFATHKSLLLSSNALVAAVYASRASCSAFHAAFTPLWASRTPN